MLRFPINFKSSIDFRKTGHERCEQREGSPG